MAVRGIGEIIAVGVESYFRNAAAKRLIEKLRKAGVNFTEPRTVRRAVPSVERRSSSPEFFRLCRARGRRKLWSRPADA